MIVIKYKTLNDVLLWHELTWEVVEARAEQVLRVQDIHPCQCGQTHSGRPVVQPAPRKKRRGLRPGSYMCLFRGELYECPHGCDIVEKVLLYDLLRRWGNLFKSYINFSPSLIPSPPVSCPHSREASCGRHRWSMRPSSRSPPLCR